MASIDTTKFLFVVAVATAAYVFLSPLLISAWIHSDSGNYENTISTEGTPAMAVP